MNINIDFDKSGGLVPAIVQEYLTNEVLMLGYMNHEALSLTLKTKIAHYFSRSRNRIWKKGEESGHIQKVMDVRFDCDKDTLLILVEQIGKTACHTGAKSCFFRSFFYDDTIDKNISISNEANLPTKYGKFKIKAYKDGPQEHLAIMSLDFFELESPLVRIHSECLTGDTLGSLKCDCNNQLHLSLELIAKHGGLVIYHRQEGRNIGLLNKINAYSLQDKGFNTIEANLQLGFKEDEREYSAVEFILKDLDVKKVRIITNNPQKIDFLELSGMEIIERIPAITPANCHNSEYLKTKKNQMGHFL